MTDSEQAFSGQEPYRSSASHTAFSSRVDVPESSQKNDTQKHVSFSPQLRRPERKRKVSTAFKGKGGREAAEKVASRAAANLNAV